MEKQLRQFNEEERRSMLSYSSLYANREANISKKQYEKQIENCSMSQDIDTVIIQCLEKLGFPLDEMGTYIYKDVISNVIDSLIKSDDETQKQQLTEQLNHTYSQFYFDVAKNDNDMGVNTFHAYIQKALAKINPEKKDLELVNQLFASSEKTLGYGEEAFVIGNFIRNIFIPKNDNYAVKKCKAK